MSSAVGAVARAARSAPFALSAVLALWVVGLMSGSIVRGPTASLLMRANLSLPVFQLDGTWYPLASRIWCADLVGYVSTTIVLVVLCVPAERLVGSVRTAQLFILTSLGATTLGIAAVELSLTFGHVWADGLRTASAAGPSAGAFGVVLALSSQLSQRWRQRVRIVSLVLLVTLALYSGQLEDFTRLVAGLLGLACGPLILGQPPSPTSTFASEQPERRLLLGLVVAAAATGPMILSVNGVLDGPAAGLKELWVSPAPLSAVVRLSCHGSAGATCQTVRDYVSTRGIGADLRMVLPVLIALVLAEGLRLGRRAAYWAAQGFHLLLALAGSTVVAARLWGRSSTISLAHANAVQLGAIVVVPLGLCLLVYRKRKEFTLRAPRGIYRRALLFAIGALAAASLSYLVGVYMTRGEFDRAIGVTDVLRNLPSRFLPPTYLGLVRPAFTPAGDAARHLSNWTGALFWVAVLCALLLSFRRTNAAPRDHDTDAIRRLLIEHGGGALSHQTTWDQTSRWFSSDGRVAIGYRVVAGVAITLGDPVGVVAARLGALEEFGQFCAQQAWTPCLFCISEEVAEELSRVNWWTIEVGEEAVIPLPALEFSGARWQDVRSALNRAQRDGITASWIAYGDAPASLRQQVAAMGSRARRSGLPELSFTIGGTSELEDRETRCVVAVDRLGDVQGVLSWLPVYEQGRTVGWTLDCMRRSEQAFNGVIDFLIGASVTTFKEEGAAFVSLSGVPFTTALDGRPRRPLEWVLGISGALLDHAFGFSGLLAFKRKFQPVFRPLFLAYLDGAALPRIALAIGRAYVPNLSWRQVAAVGGHMLLHRYHAAAPRRRRAFGARARAANA